tara:strand:+ start:554 stop:1009 length:456 start_codon:yes stop_codon:yes gene_type:complete
MVSNNLLYLFFSIFIFSYYSYSQNSISVNDSIGIMNVMTFQEKAWNNGDINLFMEGYLKSKELVFSGSSGPVYGWKATKQRYFKSYPTLESMGQLTFSVTRIKSLTPTTAYLIGEYYLKRVIDDSFGHFTLIWKNIEGKWLIVSDHTSSSK